MSWSNNLSEDGKTLHWGGIKLFLVSNKNNGYVGRNSFCVTCFFCEGANRNCAAYNKLPSESCGREDIWTDDPQRAITARLKS